MRKPVKWAAELEHVREVSLRGTADLAFWKDRLRHETLLPLECEGQAEVMVTAADLRYFGIRFREISFSIVIDRQEEGTRRDAAYLVQAYNSVRPFAFVERTFFSTPYDYADVRVSAAFPASIQLFQHGTLLFKAEMAVDDSTREPTRVEEEHWEGPVYLPTKARTRGGDGKVFVARLSGTTRVYPTIHSRDTFVINPSSPNVVLQALSDSHFSIREWLVREDAAHAKSKTYRRTDLFPN